MRSYFNKAVLRPVVFLLRGSITNSYYFGIKPKEGVSVEDLELEMIDYGVDEVEADEEEIVLYGEFSENNNIQHHLEEAVCEIVSAEFERS